MNCPTLWQTLAKSFQEKRQDPSSLRILSSQLLLGAKSISLFHPTAPDFAAQSPRPSMIKSRAANNLGSRIASFSHQSACGEIARVLNSTPSKSLYVSYFCQPRYFSQRHISIRNHNPSASFKYSPQARAFSRLGSIEHRSANKRPSTSSSNPRNIKQSCSSKLLASSQKPQESSFGSWTAALIVCVAIAVYSASSELVSSKKTKHHTRRELLDDIEQEISNMTGEALPGRPGTLTPEQEENLREFWIATLQVFGVLDAKDVNGKGSAAPGAARARSDTESSKKPKKKRMSMFRRGKECDDSESVTSTDSTPAASDSDDKYGQTKEFHEALASMSPESLRATFWSMVKHDHPDALLLRFLRARKWDVEKALVMMVSTMRWRSMDQHVDDDIMKNGELRSLEDESGSDPEKKRHGHGFLAQLRMGKSYIHGSDKSGRPMCFVRVKLHKQGEQSEESLERYTVFLIESARMTLAPPVDTAVSLF